MRERAIQAGLVVANLIFVVCLYFFVDFIHRGGFLMIPMLFCSFLCFAIIFSKLRQLNSEAIDTDDLLTRVFESIERQRIKEALELCEAAPSSVSRVLKSGIMKYDRPKDEIKESMEEAFMYEGPMLEEKLPLLSTTIQIIPFLGLLGALGGFMKILVIVESGSSSFSGVSLVHAAPGMWESLVCSATGFLTVIPILVAYNYFSCRIKVMGDEMERAAAELLNFLMERRMPL